MPAVYYYHAFTESILINAAVEDARGLEKAADFLLTPSRYLFAGKRAELLDSENHIYTLKQEYAYQEKFLWHKTAASIMALPFSLTAGSLLKTAALLDKSARRHYQDLARSVKNAQIRSNASYYEKIGLNMAKAARSDWIDPPQYKRRPGDENLFRHPKEALREIARILNYYDIPFWLDCGSCLGAYRYGGVIPWDNDLDIAVLQSDFENVKNALRQLDPKKYIVQDWSSRDKPGTYLKVYVRESRDLIDIYHYAINEEEKTLYTVISNEDCIFLPESWKVRERYCAAPISFDVIFPLKKALFDGVEVFVPNKTKEFLQSKYGEDISPAKIYNEETGQFEKDLSHPYWQRQHVH